MGMGSGVGSMAAPLQPMPTPRLASGSGSKSAGAEVSVTTETPRAAYAVDAGSSVGGEYGEGVAREISIPVPEDAKVPAVFFDGEEKPVAQQKALDRIAEEFEQNVSEIPEGMTQEEVWDAARLIADERYMTLFGYQAYNQYHMKAAKEALKEKRARSQATEP